MHVCTRVRVPALGVSRLTCPCVRGHLRASRCRPHPLPGGPAGLRCGFLGQARAPWPKGQEGALGGGRGGHPGRAERRQSQEPECPECLQGAVWGDGILGQRRCGEAIRELALGSRPGGPGAVGAARSDGVSVGLLCEIEVRPPCPLWVGEQVRACRGGLEQTRHRTGPSQPRTFGWGGGLPLFTCTVLPGFQPGSPHDPHAQAGGQGKEAS